LLLPRHLYRAQLGRPSSYPAWSGYPETPTSNPNPLHPPVILHTASSADLGLRYVLREDQAPKRRVWPPLFTARPMKNTKR
jgi:hypothetical protein